jgi:uncharacterized protein
MQIENAVTIPSAPERAWDLLADVPRVIPCMPGTELVSVEGSDRWTAAMRVQVGPMRLVFDVDLNRQTMDEASRTIALEAAAVERKGRGSAKALLTCSLDAVASGEETRMRTVTELTLAGRLAQFARGVVEQLAADMSRDFAAGLAAELRNGDAPIGGPAKAPSAPVAGAELSASGAVPARSGQASSAPPSSVSPPAASARVGRKLLPAILRALGTALRDLLRRRG